MSETVYFPPFAWDSIPVADKRKNLGLSAYAVAKHLGCSRTHYVLFERGERRLSAPLLAKLQSFFDQQQQTKATNSK